IPAVLEVQAQDAVPALEHLLPDPVPEAMRGDTLEQALKSNQACVLVKPEVLLEGLVPEVSVDGPAVAEPADDIRPAVGHRHAIAFIGSEDLAGGLAHDVEVARRDAEHWEQQLASREFSFLVNEPVWHDGRRRWRNTLTRHGRERSHVPALTAYARERRLPVVVWFRHDVEDLEHFAWLEQFADAVYAVDERLAEALAKLSGRTASVLRPAIQPAIHNPFRTWAQLECPEWRRHVLFDGWLDLAEGAAADPLVQELKDERLLVAESSWEFGGVRLNDHPEFM